MTPTQDTKEEAAQAAEAREVDAPADILTSGTSERRRGPDLDIIRAGAIIIAILGLLALLHFAASVFITLFSAMLLAFALEPVVHFLCMRTRLRRHHASGIVVFLFVAMLYGLFYATYLRAENFLGEIPAIAEKIRSAPMVARLTEKADELNRVFAEAGRRIVPPPAASARPKTAPPVDVRAEAETFTGTLLQGSAPWAAPSSPSDSSPSSSTSSSRTGSRSPGGRGSFSRRSTARRWERSSSTSNG